MEQIATALETIFYHLQRAYAPTCIPAPTGLPAAEVLACLATVPCVLPDDACALYQCYNGVPMPPSPPYPYTQEFLPAWDFLPLARAHAAYQQQSHHALYAPSPTAWQPAWWPLFALDYSFYVIWCPATSQPTAPIFEVSRGQGDDDIWMAYDSVTSLLRTVAACYDTGAYWIDDTDEVAYDTRRESAILRHYNPQRTAWWLAQAGVSTVVDLVACLHQASAPTDAWSQGARALQALHQLLDPQTVPPLLHLLQGTNLVARFQAIEILGDLGDPRAVAPLITVLRDEEAPLRVAAALALGKLGDTQAVEPLLHTLHDTEEEVRQEAVQALGLLGDQRAGPDLLQMLPMVKKPSDRVRLYEALGAVRAPEAVPLWLRALREGPSTLQGIAATALGRIGDLRAVPALVAVLSYALADVRRHAVAALGRLEAMEAVEPLSAALQSDPDEQVRQEAARACGQLCRGQRARCAALPALFYALRDPSPGVRRHAARALVHLQLPPTHPGLQQLLDDAEEEVGQHVTWILEKLRR